MTKKKLAFETLKDSSNSVTKPKSSPSIFEYELSQYELDLKMELQEKHPDEGRVKDLNRYIRNLRAIIKCLQSKK